MKERSIAKAVKDYEELTAKRGNNTGAFYASDIQQVYDKATTPMGGGRRMDSDSNGTTGGLHDRVQDSKEGSTPEALTAEKERVEEAVDSTENFKTCPFCGGGYEETTPTGDRGHLQPVPEVRGCRRDRTQQQRGIIYALDYSRACTELQERRDRLDPETARAYNLIGLQPTPIEAVNAIRLSTLEHLTEYSQTIEPCYYSKVVYDTFLDVGLDLYILGKLTGKREERARRKRGKTY